MFDTLLRILALTRKELLAVLKDPRSRITLFVPPMIQCLVFGYAATFDLNHIAYAVLDQDRSQASRQLLAGLDGSGIFERVATLDRASDAKTLVDNRGALLVLQIGPDFERRLLSGQAADVQVIADGRNSNTAATALSYVNTVVDSFNSSWRAAHGVVGGPIQVTTRAWYNANLETRWHIVPSMTATLTLIELMLLTAMSVAREREQGTLDQLLVTPFRPAEIMAGKALPSMLIGLVQATVILLVAQLWFHIPFAGSYLTLYASLSLFLLAAVGAGLLISMVAANLQQALLFSFLLVMPFVLLSGLFTPLSSMPVFLQYLDVANPLRYAIDIAQRVYLEGVGLGRLTSDLIPLAIVAAATLSVSSWMFRRRLA
jgi:pyoluteorin transport system permease protein